MPALSGSNNNGNCGKQCKQKEELRGMPVSSKPLGPSKDEAKNLEQGCLDFTPRKIYAFYATLSRTYLSETNQTSIFHLPSLFSYKEAVLYFIFKLQLWPHGRMKSLNFLPKITVIFCKIWIREKNRILRFNNFLPYFWTNLLRLE